MKVIKNWNQEIFKAAVMLLQNAVPGLTATQLMAALKEYEESPEQKPKSPDMLTVAETAKILNVHTVTVQRYLTTGLLPRIKVGKRMVRIPREAVNKLFTEE